MNHNQILIIDSDGTVLEIIKLSLQITTDWKILTAGSEKEGVILALANQPDVILLDITICNCNGNKVLYQLSTYTKTQKIPIILLTADIFPTTELLELKNPNLEVKTIIFKPFDAIGLSSQISPFLQTA